MAATRTCFTAITTLIFTLYRFLRRLVRKSARDPLISELIVTLTHALFIDFPGAPEPSTFGDQLAWLENDLKIANSMRDIYPWILVAGHRPIYSSVHGESEDGKPIKHAKKIQEAMEHLFHKYKVDLFICGHVHSYERIYPTYKSEVKSQSYHNAEDTAYVVIGTGG